MSDYPSSSEKTKHECEAVKPLGIKRGACERDKQSKPGTRNSHLAIRNSLSLIEGLQPKQKVLVGRRLIWSGWKHLFTSSCGHLNSTGLQMAKSLNNDSLEFSAGLEHGMWLRTR